MECAENRYTDVEVGTGSNPGCCETKVEVTKHEGVQKIKLANKKRSEKSLLSFRKNPDLEKRLVTSCKEILNELSIAFKNINNIE